MTPTALPPMDVGDHGFDGGSAFFQPAFGLAVLGVVLLLVLVTVVLLSFAAAQLLRPAPPELDAKKVLAERLARGDISSDDFLDRASTLNWTPGSEQWTRRRLSRH